MDRLSGKKGVRGQGVRGIETAVAETAGARNRDHVTRVYRSRSLRN